MNFEQHIFKLITLLLTWLKVFVQFFDFLIFEHDLIFQELKLKVLRLFKLFSQLEIVAYLYNIAGL